MSLEPAPTNASTFTGGGLAGAALRARDWRDTPLGPMDAWPAALKAHVRTMLHVRRPVAIFWGPELVNIYNDGFLPLLADKHPIAMGQPATACWAEAWPVIGRQVEDVLASGRSFVAEEVLVPITRAGRLEDAWWTYTYSPLFDDAGTVRGVLVVCAEITREVNARRRLDRARRDAELARKELHDFFMQTPVPMCIVTGSEHRFTLVNPLFTELVDGRHILGKNLREAFDDDAIHHYEPILARVRRTAEPVVVREAPLRRVRPDGRVTERLVDFVYHPHRDASDDVTGVLVLVHDVTAQVLARREIEEVARTKDELLAAVSHELRTPLTAIIGWASILCESPEPARIRKGLPIIERNARMQAKLVDDLLDVSRVATGKLRLEIAPVDVTGVVVAAVDAARPAAAAKGLHLEVTADVRSPILADGARLQQIVWNLVANAVKHTPRGGTIHVRAEDHPDHVCVEVEDTGDGIPPALLPHLFEPFRQGTPGDASARRGLGLGLAIVRQLVELHGGTVTAASDGDGRGARFVVLLPARGRTGS